VIGAMELRSCEAAAAAAISGFRGHRHHRQSDQPDVSSRLASPWGPRRAKTSMLRGIGSIAPFRLPIDSPWANATWQTDYRGLSGMLAV
jgi:hypothetical protein